MAAVLAENKTLMPTILAETTVYQLASKFLINVGVSGRGKLLSSV